MSVETRPNGTRITTTHEWIRIDLGNSRGLTTSFGGEKATGAVPESVFKAWLLAVDGKGKYPGTNRGEWVTAFADDMDNVWPGWGKAPDTSHLVVGYKGSMNLGPRKGNVDYEIVALPKRKGGSYTIRMEGRLTLVAADMLK